MIDRRQLMAAAAAACGAVALPAARGLAQDRYPDQPVRLIVPFPAGGPADLVGRLLAKALTEQLGASFVVDNRAGAGGIIGIEAVARARPDGITLGIGSGGAMSVLPHLMKMPFDVARDIQPISLVIAVPQVLCVHPSVPARNVQELIALARAKPGSLTYGSSGNGNSLHLAAEMLRDRAGGLELVHVPYRGAAPALTDLVAGQVQMMFGDVPVMLPQIQSGAIRPLAVTAPERSVALPEVPTMEQAGVKDMDSESYYGLIAPAGLAPAKVEILHRATVAALRDPATRKLLVDQGGRVSGNTPLEFAAYIQAETVKWGEVIRKAGVRLD
jgi:tripartite-type tricarboxylate transporter receptor subunit TctC